MSDHLRDHLKSRAIKAITRKKYKSPSEKRSENVRKRLNRGEKPAIDYLYTCHTCTKNCGMTIEVCGEARNIRRCNHCGRYMMYYLDPNGRPCIYCDECKEMHPI